MGFPHLEAQISEYFHPIIARWNLWEDKPALEALAEITEKYYGDEVEELKDEIARLKNELDKADDKIASLEATIDSMDMQ